MTRVDNNGTHSKRSISRIIASLLCSLPGQQLRRHTIIKADKMSNRERYSHNWSVFDVEETTVVNNLMVFFFWSLTSCEIFVELIIYFSCESIFLITTTISLASDASPLVLVINNRSTTKCLAICNDNGRANVAPSSRGIYSVIIMR